jgi:hypothetical protein
MQLHFAWCCAAAAFCAELLGVNNQGLAGSTGTSCAKETATTKYCPARDSVAQSTLLPVR